MSKTRDTKECEETKLSAAPKGEEKAGEAPSYSKISHGGSEECYPKGVVAKERLHLELLESRPDRQGRVADLLHAMAESRCGRYRVIRKVWIHRGARVLRRSLLLKIRSTVIAHLVLHMIMKSRYI